MVVQTILMAKRTLAMTLGAELLFDIDEMVNGHFETFETARVGFCGLDLKGLGWIFKDSLAKDKTRKFEKIVWVGFPPGLDFLGSMIFKSSCRLKGLRLFLFTVRSGAGGHLCTYIRAILLFVWKGIRTRKDSTGNLLFLLFFSPKIAN